MVGVSFVFIMYCLFGSAYSFESCPKICNCLGDYLLCTGRTLENSPRIPSWAGRVDLNNNRLTQLPGSSWANARNITQLKLSKNRISKLNKEGLINQTSLQLLELNRNQIKSVAALSFSHLNKLTVLKMKRNRISKLYDGAFFGLASIKSLKLDFNLIQTISKSWLYSLNSLKDLSLNHNRINNIEVDAWEFCPLLLDLDLSYNILTGIKKDTFQHLYSLQKLLLNNNHISFIEDESFLHTPNLKTLSLSNNKISFIIEDSSGIFKALTKLHKFYIAANDITSINKNAFLGLSSVTILDLSLNNISTIQKNAFFEMSQLEELHLTTTSFLCDCNIKWFNDWLTSQEIEKVNAVCAFPEALRGVSVTNVPPANLTCGELVKPRLIIEPEPEIMALKNANITLICRAIANAPSEIMIQWKKDNKELEHPNVTVKTLNQKKTTEVLSTLNINNVQHNDAGLYQCVAQNGFGATYSQKTNISVLIFPTFVKIPKNVTVPLGDTVRLECAAEGEPPPQISWQKDGGNDFPSARERRIHVMTTDDMIFILKAKPVDMGIYTCTAGNPAGKITANAILTIEEKPYFGKPMEDKEITAGESIVLQCNAAGMPKPTIQWMKDGAPIHATERHFFTAEEQLMIIVDTLSSDQGSYQCLLNNSLGKVAGYSQLIVKPAIGVQSDKMGVIIITIACCAVITSIIWVFIIYHAKKRRLGRAQAANTQTGEVATSNFSDQNLNPFVDDVSEHSSCKDSGTGDSAKRSNDDLLPQEDFAVIVNDANPVDSQSNMRTASLLCLNSGRNNLHSPLVSENTFVRSTNHDRLDDNIFPAIDDEDCTECSTQERNLS